MIRRLTKPARGAAWALGVFASNGDLREFAMQGLQSNVRAALDMLSTVPEPMTSKVVALKVTAEDGKLARTLRGSILLDGGRLLAFIAVRPTTTDKAWSMVAQGMQPAVRRIAALINAEGVPAQEPTPLPMPTRSDGSGFLLLNSDLNVVFQWHPEDAASAELAKLVEPEHDRLPLLLERTVRRLTRRWDFARIETCTPARAQPLPGLLLRVAPVRGAGVLIGVFLEPFTDHPMERAASEFRISPRERDVLYALLDGRGVNDIAAMLNIAESTVSDHIARMIAKTNARNRVEMAATLLGWPRIKAALQSARGAHSNGNGSNDATPRWLQTTRRSRRNHFVP
ncbi:MAG: helix-turn-helix transcriptional regulator [Candidatus Eremiobacteraeota bacterium]|nr:helix-turn-helix transcriptional regulator [Candidatus Eremiobacteraeota bacterium]